MKRTANLTGKIGTVTYFPRQRPTGKNGDRRKIGAGKMGTGTHFAPTRSISDGDDPRKMGACPHFPNERGVALLMALAVLVLMAILAVSFYSSQSLEREGADNARYARSAEAVAESGLNWAMDLLARDKDDAAGGLTLAYDTDYDIWAALAKDHSPAYARADDLLFNGSNDEVDLSPLIDGNDARWIDVHDGTRLIGRFAVIVEDESGKANVNVAGNFDGTGILMPRDGISPAEVLLNVILEQASNKVGTPLADPVVSAQEIVALRQGGGMLGGDGAPGVLSNDDDGDGPLGYRYCDDNLNGVIDEDGATKDATDEPDEHDLNALKGDDIVLDDLSTILLAQSIKAYKDANQSNLDKPFEKLLAYLTVESRTQDVYQVNDTSPWQAMTPLDSAKTNVQTIHDRLEELRNATPPRLPLSVDADQLNQIAANIADFIDPDGEPTALGGKIGIEKTPYLNEVEATPATYTLSGNVIHDHGEFIELINPYDVPVTVIVRASQQGPNGESGVIEFPATVPARTGDRVGQEGYWVIGDRSGWYEYVDPDTGVRTTYYLANLPGRPANCDDYQNLYLGGTNDITITTEGGQTIEIATAVDISSPEGAVTAQKNDPRIAQWDPAGETRRSWNNDTCKPGDSGDKDANGLLSDLFAVYDGKLGSIGVLGKVFIGQPWATINLTGDEDLDGSVDIDWDNAYSTATWLNILDIFTTASNVNQPRCGLINVNTAPMEVLSGLKGLKAQDLYNATHPAAGAGRVIESIGELGEFLDMTGTATWDREKHLADIASLVSVRSSVFRVTVCAQALGRQGEVDKRGERWLQASVERTIVPGPLPPKVTVRVLSMRWLVQE